MAEIKQIRAREILDSRGNPTIEADVMVRPLGYIDYITTRVGYSLTGFTEEEV